MDILLLKPDCQGCHFLRKIVGEVVEGVTELCSLPKLSILRSHHGAAIIALTAVKVSTMSCSVPTSVAVGVPWPFCNALVSPAAKFETSLLIPVARVGKALRSSIARTFPSAELESSSKERLEPVISLISTAATTTMRPEKRVERMWLTFMVLSWDCGLIIVSNGRFS